MGAPRAARWGAATGLMRAFAVAPGYRTASRPTGRPGRAHHAPRTNRASRGGRIPPDRLVGLTQPRHAIRMPTHVSAGKKIFFKNRPKALDMPPGRSNHARVPGMVPSTGSKED